MKKFVTTGLALALALAIGGPAHARNKNKALDDHNPGVTNHNFSGGYAFQFGGFSPGAGNNTGAFSVTETGAFVAVPDNDNATNGTFVSPSEMSIAELGFICRGEVSGNYALDSDGDGTGTMTLTLATDAQGSSKDCPATFTFDYSISVAAHAVNMMATGCTFGNNNQCTQFGGAGVALRQSNGNDSNNQD